MSRSSESNKQTIARMKEYVVTRAAKLKTPEDRQFFEDLVTVMDILQLQVEMLERELLPGSEFISPTGHNDIHQRLR